MINSYSILFTSKYFQGKTATTTGVTGIYTIGKKLGFVAANTYYLKEDSRVKWMANETWNFTTKFDGIILLN